MLLLGLAAPSFAGPVEDARDGLDAALESVARAAAALIDEEPGEVALSLDSVLAAATSSATAAGADEVADALGRRARGVRRRIERLGRRAERVRTRIVDTGAPDPVSFRLLRGLARVTDATRRRLRPLPYLGAAVRAAGRATGGFYRPGAQARLLVELGSDAQGAPCTEVPDVRVESGAALTESAVSPTPVDLGGGRWVIALGPDPGAARVVVTACGVARSYWIVNTGPRRALRTSAPRGLWYPASLVIRAGRALGAVAPTVAGGAPETFSVEPQLPVGLTLDPASGAIAGTPQEVTPVASYTVVARNRRGTTAATLEIEVAPALPEGVEELAAGFTIERLAQGLGVATRVARAPDGRIFVTELMSGDVRIIDAAGTLRSTPFAHVDVLTGGERGLMGLALAPDFTDSGHVYVYASVPASGEHAARNQVLRFTADGDAGIDPTVILDDLPLGLVQNGGALAFGPDGRLYVTVGDTGDAAAAQDPASAAGKVLRVEPDGGLPADNPDPGSPVWCRGLRNAYDLTFHPVTGGLFATENGPTFGDELNLIQGGKNYEWGAEPESVPGALIGPRLMEWTPVIVPTGAVFHDGTGFGVAFADNLFLCGYDDADVRRLVMSGPQRTDVDQELEFLRFDNTGIDHKPLDVIVEPDGSLLVATFSSVWRIDRY